MSKFDAVNTEIDQRRAQRYESTATIRINGFEGQALINNINTGGFCMTSKTYVEIGQGQRYTMQIIPEPNAQLETIELEVEVRWTRVTGTRFIAGFQILRSNQVLKTYITYLEKK
jgi:hypothetical protein